MTISTSSACEGVMACSTCHVIVAEDYCAKLDDPSEEEDLLDLAWGCARRRLGCQIVVTDDLDGMELLLPASTNNQILEPSNATVTDLYLPVSVPATAIGRSIRDMPSCTSLRQGPYRRGVSVTI